MASIYSVSFGSGHAALSGHVENVTLGVPGDTVVLREINVSPSSGAGDLGQGLWAQIVGPPDLMLWWAVHPRFPRDRTHRWEGRLVLVGGSTLRLTFLSSQLDWFVSGYRFVN